MHTETVNQYGVKVVMLKAANLGIEVEWKETTTIPQSPVEAIIPDGEWIKVVFRDGQKADAVLRKVIDGGSGSPADFAAQEWSALVRAGLVPGHGEASAEKLDACAAAQQALAVAQAAYRAAIEQETSVKEDGTYGDSRQWREIPGIPFVSFEV